MVFDRANSLGYLTTRLSRRLAAALQEELGPLGLTPSQFSALLELDASDGLTQAELCTRLGVEQPSMAQTIARLRRDGFVRPARHEADRRATRLWLTDAARAVLPAAVTAAERTNEQALHALGPARARALLTALRQLTTD